MEPDGRLNLYKYLQKKKAYSGSFEDFSKSLDTEDGIKNIYNYMSDPNRKLYTGDYEALASTLRKKDITKTSAEDAKEIQQSADEQAKENNKPVTAGQMMAADLMMQFGGTPTNYKLNKPKVNIASGSGKRAFGVGGAGTETGTFGSQGYTKNKEAEQTAIENEKQRQEMAGKGPLKPEEEDDKFQPMWGAPTEEEEKSNVQAIRDDFKKDVVDDFNNSDWGQRMENAKRMEYIKSRDDYARNVSFNDWMKSAPSEKLADFDMSQLSADGVDKYSFADNAGGASTIGGAMDYYLKKSIDEHERNAELASNSAMSNFRNSPASVQMMQGAIAAESAADPKDIIDSAMSSFMNGNSDDISNFVFNRLNLDTKEGGKKDGVHVLTAEEKKAIDSFNKHHKYEYDKVANLIQQEMYKRMQETFGPKSNSEYVLSKFVHDSIVGMIANIAVERAANSSGLRQQMMAAATEKFGENADTFTKIKGTLAPIYADILAGPMRIAGAAGQVARTAAKEAMVGQVLKQAGKKALAETGEKIIASGAKKAVERAIDMGALGAWRGVALDAISNAATFASLDDMSNLVGQWRNGTFDVGELLSTTAKGAVKGALLGTLSGSAREFTRNSGTTSKALSDVGSFLGEVGLFSGFSMYEKAAAAGIPITELSHNDIVDFITESAGMVGGMKIIGYATNPEVRKAMKLRYSKSSDFGMNWTDVDTKAIEDAGYNINTLMSDLLGGPEVFKDPGGLKNIFRTKEFGNGKISLDDQTATRKEKRPVYDQNGRIVGETEVDVPYDVFADADNRMLKAGEEGTNEYLKFINDGNIPLSTRLKIRYYYEGAFPTADINDYVYNSGMYEKDGKYIVDTYDEFGGVVSRNIFSSKEKAQKALEVSSDLADDNAIQAGLQVAVSESKLFAKGEIKNFVNPAGNAESRVCKEMGCTREELENMLFNMKPSELGEKGRKAKRLFRDYLWDELVSGLSIYRTAIAGEEARVVGEKTRTHADRNVVGDDFEKASNNVNDEEKAFVEQSGDNFPEAVEKAGFTEEVKNRLKQYYLALKAKLGVESKGTKATVEMVTPSPEKEGENALGNNDDMHAVGDDLQKASEDIESKFGKDTQHTIDVIEQNVDLGMSDEDILNIFRFNPDRLDTVKNYVTAYRKSKGMVEGVDDKVNSEVEKERQNIAPYVQSDGTFTTAKINGQEVYISKYEEGAQNIYYYDENGDVKMVQAGLVDNIKTVNAEKYLSNYGESLRKQYEEEAQWAISHNVKTKRDLSPGTVIETNEGKLVIMGEDGNGNLIVKKGDTDATTGEVKPKGEDKTITKELAYDKQDNFYENRPDTPEEMLDYKPKKEVVEDKVAPKTPTQPTVEQVQTPNTEKPKAEPVKEEVKDTNEERVKLRQQRSNLVEDLSNLAKDDVEKRQAITDKINKIDKRIAKINKAEEKYNALQSEVFDQETREKAWKFIGNLETSTREDGKLLSLSDIRKEVAKIDDPVLRRATQQYLESKGVKARLVRRKKQESGKAARKALDERRSAEAKALGDYVSVRDFILRELGWGDVKFIWKTSDSDTQKGTVGLGDRYSYSDAEFKKMQPKHVMPNDYLVSQSKGLSFDDYMHKVAEDYQAYTGLSWEEAFDAISKEFEDVVLECSTREDARRKAKEIQRNKVDEFDQHYLDEAKSEAERLGFNSVEDFNDALMLGIDNPEDYEAFKKELFDNNYLDRQVFFSNLAENYEYEGKEVESTADNGRENSQGETPENVGGGNVSVPEAENGSDAGNIEEGISNGVPETAGNDTAPAGGSVPESSSADGNVRSEEQLRSQEREKIAFDKAKEIDDAIAEQEKAVELAKKRLSNKRAEQQNEYGKDNTLFGDGRQNDAPELFDVERDYSKENIEAGLKPYVDELAKEQAKLDELKAGRDKAIQDAVDAYDRQSTIYQAEGEVSANTNTEKPKKLSDLSYNELNEVYQKNLDKSANDLLKGMEKSAPKSDDFMLKGKTFNELISDVIPKVIEYGSKNFQNNELFSGKYSEDAMSTPISQKLYDIWKRVNKVDDSIYPAKFEDIDWSGDDAYDYAYDDPATLTKESGDVVKEYIGIEEYKDARARLPKLEEMYKKAKGKVKNGLSIKISLTKNIIERYERSNNPLVNALKIEQQRRDNDLTKKFNNFITGAEDVHLLAIMEKGEKHPFFYGVLEEYDKRHEAEYQDEYDFVIGNVLNSTIEQVEEMLDNTVREYRNGGYKSPDRAKLRGQIDALSDRHSELLENSDYNSLSNDEIDRAKSLAKDFLDSFLTDNLAAKNGWGVYNIPFDDIEEIATNIYERFRDYVEDDDIFIKSYNRNIAIDAISDILYDKWKSTNKIDDSVFPKHFKDIDYSGRIYELAGELPSDFEANDKATKEDEDEMPQSEYDAIMTPEMRKRLEANRPNQGYYNNPLVEVIDDIAQDTDAINIYSDKELNDARRWLEGAIGVGKKGYETVYDWDNEGRLVFNPEKARELYDSIRYPIEHYANTIRKKMADGVSKEAEKILTDTLNDLNYALEFYKELATGHEISNFNRPAEGFDYEPRFSLKPNRESRRIDEEYLKLAQNYIADFSRKDEVGKQLQDMFNRYVLALADEGISPILYVNRYRKGGSHYIAHALKGENTAVGTQEALKGAASEMAPLVPENAVLVPIPSHTGKATDTKVLADEIAKLTGSEVVEALEGKDRISNYEKKKSTGKGLTPEEIGFVKVKDVPEGKQIIFIDNVVASGATAASATRAMGGGVTLAYAYSGDVNNATNGVKSAEVVTYDDNGNVIPLSERFSPSNDIRYSLKPKYNSLSPKYIKYTFDEMESGDVPFNGKLLQDEKESKFKVIDDEKKKFRNWYGSVQKRYEDNVGKLMGGVYVHKDYATEVIPDNVWEKAKAIADEAGFKYNCVYYDPAKPNIVRFDEAPDFDTAREPITGDYMKVDVNTGKPVSLTNSGKTVGHSDQIWHNKWMWVKDDYKGFDVQKAYDWSKEWNQKISNPDGLAYKWEYLLQKAGLPVDWIGSALSEGWAMPMMRTSEELDRNNPGWRNQTTDSGGHSTQIKGTLSSYQRIGEHLKNEGNKNVSILDASSGFGHGTQALRDMGFKVDDVEPYPSSNRETAPTFTSYDDIDKKYDVVISNAVLNVIPDDWRAGVLASMADKVKPGGKMIINTRDAAGIAKQGKEGVTRETLDSPSEILVKDKNSGNYTAYQKGFTKEELKSYVENELGEGWRVEIGNEKNSGLKSGTVVVAHKNRLAPNMLDRANKLGELKNSENNADYPEKLRTFETELVGPNFAKQLGYKNDISKHDEFTNQHKGALTMMQYIDDEAIEHQMKARGYDDDEVELVRKAVAEGKEGGASAVFFKNYDKDGDPLIVIIKPDHIEGNVEDYWHEHGHLAMDKLFDDRGKSITQGIVYEFTNAYPKDMEKVESAYSGKSASTIREEKVMRIFGKKMAAADGDIETVKAMLEEDGCPKAAELFDNIHNYIHNGTSRENQIGQTEGGRNGQETGESASTMLDSNGSGRKGLGGAKLNKPSTYKLSNKGIEVANKSSASVMFTAKMNSAWSQFVTIIQDNGKPIREAVLAIEKATGIPVKGEDNPYMGANHLSSINMKELELVDENNIQPLQKAADEITDDYRKKEGGTAQDARDALTTYMIAKHGIERNKVFALRQAKKMWKEKNPVVSKRIEELEAKSKTSTFTPADKSELEALTVARDFDITALESGFRKRDFSGLTSLFNKDTVSEAEAAASSFIANFENGRTALTDQLWAKINKTTGDSLLKQYSSGNISKELYDYIDSMFEYYIPLKGFDEVVAEDEYNYMGQMNYRYQKPVVKAEGRSSVAFDPLANIATDAQASVASGNKNAIVKLPLLRMIEKHPTDLFSLSDLWVKEDTVDGESAYVPVYEATDPDTGEYYEIGTPEFEEYMKAHPKTYLKKKEHPEIPLRVLYNSDRAQHNIIIYRNGEPIVATVNGDPLLAQAINGLLSPYMGDELLNSLRGGTRFIARGATSRNPEFIGGNLSRDLIYANTMVWIKEGPKYAWEYNKNWKYVFTRLKKYYQSYDNKTLNLSDNDQRLFHEFITNGGETGYTFLKSPKDWQKELDHVLGNKKSKAITMQHYMELWDNAWKTFNSVAEGTSRFAAYKTSREMGRSIPESIHDAKEITVNFNTHGAGTKALKPNSKAYMRNIANLYDKFIPLYAFSNPGIQGQANFFGSILEHPFKASPILGAIFLHGFFSAFLNTVLASLWDDNAEEDYFKIPPYKRRNNLCLAVGKGYFFTTPLPIELRSIYGLGELIYCQTNGHEIPTEDFIKEIFSQFTQLFPIDILESGALSTRSLYPTGVRMFGEVSDNENFAGMNIWKKVYGKDEKFMPSYLRASDKTNPVLVELSKRWNMLLGGDEKVRSEFVANHPYLDTNPSAVQHIFEAYLGGLLKLPNNVLNTALMVYDKIADPKNAEWDFSKNPIIDRFIYQVKDEYKDRSINDMFYANESNMERLEYQIKEWQDEAKQKQSEANAIKWKLDNSFLEDDERKELEEDYKDAVNGYRYAKENSDNLKKQGQFKRNAWKSMKKKYDKINKDYKVNKDSKDSELKQKAKDEKAYLNDLMELMNKVVDAKDSVSIIKMQSDFTKEHKAIQTEEDNKEQ